MVLIELNLLLNKDNQNGNISIYRVRNSTRKANLYEFAQKPLRNMKEKSMKISKKYPPSLFKFKTESQMGDWIENFTGGLYSVLLASNKPVYAIDKNTSEQININIEPNVHYNLFPMKHYIENKKYMTVLSIGFHRDDVHCKFIYNEKWLRKWMKESFRDIIDANKRNHYYNTNIFYKIKQYLYSE